MSTPETDTRSRGLVGEEIAVHHLRQLGMRILETNFRYGKMGEIDIVAMDGETMVFCEVKLRRNDEYGPPQAAITAGKQRKIRRLAEAYLFQHDIGQHACRFDVVCIRRKGKSQEIDYIPNAF
jgi:putative endonuclease